MYLIETVCKCDIRGSNKWKYQTILFLAQVVFAFQTDILASHWKKSGNIAILKFHNKDKRVAPFIQCLSNNRILVIVFFEIC